MFMETLYFEDYAVGERFITPVKIGDTIRCQSEVAVIEIKDDKQGIILCRTSIKNQKNEDAVVCSARDLVGRKPVS